MQETRPFLPIGFKFRPSDEELIESYLYKMVSGIPIPFVDRIVRVCDLYGSLEPWEIWTLYGGPFLHEDEDLYFFTQLKKKNPKSSRFCRKIGSGVWQGEDAANEILSHKSQHQIGSKKRFRYENKGGQDDGGWIMHEYSLHSSMLGQNQSTNQWVICRIRRNQPSGKDKRSLSLAKKRKLHDLQSKNNQSVEQDRVLIPQQNPQQIICVDDKTTSVMLVQEEPCCYTILSNTSDPSAEAERLSTRQEDQQITCINNAKCNSQATMVMVVQEEASCSTDMTTQKNPSDLQCDSEKGISQRRETDMTDYLNSIADIAPLAVLDHDQISIIPPEDDVVTLLSKQDLCLPPKLCPESDEELSEHVLLGEAASNNESGIDYSGVADKDIFRELTDEDPFGNLTDEEIDFFQQMCPGSECEEIDLLDMEAVDEMLKEFHQLSSDYNLYADRC